MPPGEKPNKVLRCHFITTVIHFNIITVNVNGSVQVTGAIHSSFSLKGRAAAGGDENKEQCIRCIDMHTLQRYAAHQPTFPRLSVCRSRGLRSCYATNQDMGFENCRRNLPRSSG